MVDYYAVLNVSRDASVEDIRSAFAKLARVLHPDKQQQSSRQQRSTANEDVFVLIDRAYKVLSDPELRAVYDRYGSVGLEALEDVRKESRKRRQHTTIMTNSNNKVGLNNGNSLEVGDYDRLGATLKAKVLGNIILHQDLEDLKRFQVKGAIHCGINCSDVLEYPFAKSEPLLLDDHDDDGSSVETQQQQGRVDVRKQFDFLNILALFPWPVRLPEISQMVVQQSVGIPIDKSNHLTIGAFAVSRSGTGSGELVLSHKHTLDTHTAITTSVRYGTRTEIPSFQVKGERLLGKDLTGEASFSLSDTQEPGYALQLSRKLSKTTHGTMRWGLGDESGFFLQVNHSRSVSQQQLSEFQRVFMETRPSYPLFESFFHGNQEQVRRYYVDQYFPASIGTSHDHFSSSKYVGLDADDADQEEFNHSQNGALSLRVSPKGSFGLEASFGKSLSRKSRGRVVLRLGTSAVDIEFSSARTISAISKFNVALSLGVTGIVLKFRFERGGIRFVLPITLARTPSIAVSLLGFLFPTTMDYMINRVIVPYQEKSKRKRYREIYDLLISNRRIAKAQRQSLLRAADLNRQQEMKPLFGISGVIGGGLVILCARYGQRLGTKCLWSENIVDDSNNNNQDSTVGLGGGETTSRVKFEEFLENEKEMRLKNSYVGFPPNIDVTVQLQFLVKDGQLWIDSPNKSDLLGFYNPVYKKPGVSPTMFIRYAFGSRVFEIVYNNDHEPVFLPNYKSQCIGYLSTRNDGSVSYADYSDR